MLRATTGLLCLLLVGFAVAPAMAQEEGDYRTRASGDWGTAQNWERFNGSSWVAVATPPTGSETITVQEGDSVFVNVAVTISGRLVNQGIVGQDGTLTIGDGGVYQHDRDDGSVPLATWAEGSTIHITGTSTVAPANRNQPYHHIIFETEELFSNLNMQFDDVTIGGDIRVLATGFGRWYLTSADPNDTSHVTIMGDVIVERGAFSVHGTSNANTTFIIDHHGDVIVNGTDTETAANFSISRGSQGLGTTTWRMHSGDFSMEGNFQTQNSTITPQGARFVFMSGDTQTLTLEGGVTISSLPIEVREGTTLDMGSSRLAGSGHFHLDEGAMLGTSLSGGVTPIFAEVVGQIQLADGSGYWFNGTEAQVTGSRMPTTVGDLYIDNAAGVTLSQETTINGTLRLMAGEFDNSIPFTLGPDAEVVEEGGSLLHAVSNEAEIGIPSSFFVDQNYPNPFNPSTTIRFGIPAHSQVTINIFNLLGQQVMTLFEGEMTAGVHELSVDLGAMPTGVYLYRVQTEFSDVTRQMVFIK